MHLLNKRALQTVSLMLLAGAATLGNAAVISFSNGFSLTPTDITDKIVAMTPFIPGTNSIPTNAVLQSYAIEYSQTISGSITIYNDGGSPQTVIGTLDTIGAVYLFSATPSGNLSGGFIQPFPLNPSDDIFGGLGPHSSKTLAKSGLAAGSHFGPSSFNLTDTQTTSDFTTNLNSVKSAWNAYVDTGTKTSTSVTNFGAGHTEYENSVSGMLTVYYTYDLAAPAPEPGTMLLLGGALLGVGLFRKRLGRR